MTVAETRRAQRSASKAILDALRRKPGMPGMTVPQLAAELRRLNVARDALETLRAAADVAIADAEPADDPLEEWGDAPTAAQLAAARKTGADARDAALARILVGALTREGTATRLGITAQAVSERRKAGKLTAIRRGREWRFPAWQFSDDDVLPGLPDLIASWPGTPVALSTWAVKPTPDLDGHAPVEEMRRRGGTERVLDLVEAVSAAAW